MYDVAKVGNHTLLEKSSRCAMRKPLAPQPGEPSLLYWSTAICRARTGAITPFTMELRPLFVLQEDRQISISLEVSEPRRDKKWDSLQLQRLEHLVSAREVWVRLRDNRQHRGLWFLLLAGKVKSTWKAVALQLMRPAVSRDVLLERYRS